MESIINPPDRVRHIMQTLRQKGHEAYAVGGCVRDALSGKTPEDWDIATSALPEMVKELFPKTADTGLKHGTVTVMLDGEAFEVTTFRIDGRYEDRRHPERVEFTGRLEDDLSRRDFTVNSMAWSEKSGLIDPFGGREDLTAKRIRAVGHPNERFNEDALRMLRAVRFAARLGFDIDEQTLEGISANRALIVNISSERIREELNGILTAAYPMKFRLLRDTGLLKLIMPEIDALFDTAQNNPHHIYNVGDHSLHAVAAIENDKCLRWAMLLHDAGKAVTKTTDEDGIDHFYGHPARSVGISEALLKRLKFDNRSMERILRLIRFHDREILLRPKAVVKAVYAVGDDIFMDLLKVKMADMAAQNPSKLQKGIEYILGIERIYTQLKEEHYCFSLKDLAVDGNDLIAMGFREGKEIGKTLTFLFEKVLEEPALNEKEKLKELAAHKSILDKLDDSCGIWKDRDDITDSDASVSDIRNRGLEK